MTSTRTKIGHGLAKGLGIKLDYRNPTSRDDKLTRGESMFSVASADSYTEDEPTAADWLRSIRPTTTDVLHYCRDLFPFTKWIHRYNVQWLIGDLVAGITIGAIVIPQGMAYASLAELPVQYGLYSSFMGVLVYWFFATSKDITIGVSNILSSTNPCVLTANLACRCYVYCYWQRCSCSESGATRPPSTRNCICAGSHLRRSHLLHWHHSTGLARGFYSPCLNRRIHDWLCPLHRDRTSTNAVGNIEFVRHTSKVILRRDPYAAVSSPSQYQCCDGHHRSGHALHHPLCIQLLGPQATSAPQSLVLL